MTANNDSSDLEALFDSIADGTKPNAPEPAAPPAAPAPAPAAASQPRAMSGIGDNDELQSLFDNVASEYDKVAVEPGAAASEPTAKGKATNDWPRQEAVFNRLGHMARELHDALCGMGYDKLIEKTVEALPDAKDRLAYVANLTEQAACRVLNATDIANPLIEDIEASAQAMGARWDRAFANQLSVEQFKQLADETRSYLKEQLPQKAQATHAQLTEIMMAQDFQDLTGQVIKKIVVLAQGLESGLMNALIDVVPEARRTEEVTSLMNGPVINPEGRSDVVVNQQQVDDLLESLGF